MLGMMNKGGQNATQPQGGNPGLASMFRNNAPAAPGGAPGGMPGQLPQIMAPQTPNIGMPPRLPPPMQSAAPVRQAAPSFGSLNELLRFQHANPGKLSPEMSNMWKKSLQHPRGGGR